MVTTPTKTDYHKPCDWSGCDRRSWKSVELGMGKFYYCKPHFNRMTGKVPMNEPVVRRVVNRNRNCYLAMCARPARALGLCNTHYQNKKAGQPDWNRFIRGRRQGYVHIKKCRITASAYSFAERYASMGGISIDDAISRLLEKYEFESRDSSNERERQYKEFFDGSLEQYEQRMRRVEEVLATEPLTVAEACSNIGVNERTYHRWKARNGGDVRPRTRAESPSNRSE